MVVVLLEKSLDCARVSYPATTRNSVFVRRLDHVRTPATAPTAPGHGQKPARDFDNGKLYRSPLPACDRTGPLMGRRRRTFIEYIDSFWARVDKSDDCWLWTGELNNHGYGVFCLWEGDTRERLYAHRFSALMAGMPLRTRHDVVMHHCDTPACVRPSHLSVGTQLENMRDALRKGRLNTDGLYAPVVKSCKNCGTEFSGTPPQRYCSSACQTEVRRRNEVQRSACIKEEA